jgi:hypothetical protein
MRLWTLHPQYLDAKGLVAVWREALLAQHVLSGATTGYRRHPQLQRFKQAPDPAGTIAAFLIRADQDLSRAIQLPATRIATPAKTTVPTATGTPTKTTTPPRTSTPTPMPRTLSKSIGGYSAYLAQ